MGSTPLGYPRTLDLPRIRGSAFLFGPRLTGKTTLLRSLASDLYIDLLDPELELSFQRQPKLFWEQLRALNKGARVIVDEVQRIPKLLDYVQKGMEELSLSFLLSGSSARKLKRGGANLLGGRAVDLRLHPLTREELGSDFNIDSACRYGTLPKIAQFLHARDLDSVRDHLKSYYTTYIKEEIQTEAITRNVGGFQRFVHVAAQSNAQVIEFANISRECAVPMSTVKEYFSILEDTLLGEFLWPWDRSERKKARPKFYFFDCGVVRAIQGQLTDPPSNTDRGFLFETWLVREIVRLRDYYKKEHQLGFWREGPHEIDLLISNSRGPVVAIECKSGQDNLSPATLKAFQLRFKHVPVIVCSMTAKTPRRVGTGLDILPFVDVIKRYKTL